MQRNPFRIQTSEQSSTQEEFLSLFGSEVLGSLPQTGLWNRLLILEAAPGAGKSTILRLFTPEVLKEVHRNRARSENAELVRHLQQLEALSPSGPNVIGTLVSCRGHYAAIDDLSIDQIEKNRWFFGLLDARVTLLSLRAICTFADLPYPRGLERISFDPIDSAVDTARVAENGFRLFEEAAQREDEITTAVDSLTDYSVDRNAFRSDLSFLRLISGSRLILDDRELVGIQLTMFDDVQNLALWQQEALIKNLENRDVRTGRWIARRLDVLTFDQLLPTGGKDGRDYERKRIEDWARNNPSFQKLLVNIADRRIQRTNLGVASFASVLDDKLRGQSELGRARAAAAYELQTVIESHGEEVAYKEWIATTTAEQDRESEDHLGNATRWRALEILTHRRRTRNARQPINQPRPSAELLQRRANDVITAAELLVTVAHKLPFYYGVERLSGLSSMNIEQFLRIGGAVFDKLILLQVTGRRNSLSAREQDSIAKSLAFSTIENLPRDVPFGADVQRLVESIGTFSQQETAKASAPYSPGVLGVGIKQSQFEVLLDPVIIRERPEIGRLSDVLKASIAHNVLEPSGPKKVKGDWWMVFFLNRLLCPAFELPVASSHHREISLSDMLYWLTYGFRPPTRQDRLLP